MRSIQFLQTFKFCFCNTMKYSCVIYLLLFWPVIIKNKTVILVQQNVTPKHFSYLKYIS